MSGGARRALSCVVIAFAVVAGAIVVLTSDGYRQTKVDLNDAGIWITKTTLSATGGPTTSSVGRLNMEVGQVDTKLDVEQGPDILQAGRTVFVRGAGSLTSVDVADPSRPPVKAALPSGEGVDIGLGGGTLALLDPESRALHVVPANGFQSGGFEGKPAGEVSEAARMAVGTDGTVHVVDGDHVRTYDADGSKRSDRKIDVDPAAELSITAAGSRSVVLDRTTRRLLVVGGRSVDLGAFGEDAILQQPAGDADTVAVATDGGLVNVPLGGGDADWAYVQDEAKSPIEPVRLKGCSYGAWEKPGRAVGACDRQDPVPSSFGSGGRLKFRVNHDRITLNDLGNGAALIMDSKPPKSVDKAWIDALTVRPEEQAENPEEGEKRTTTADSNKDLKANPINISAREGRPRSIPALASAPGAIYVREVSQPSAGTASVGLNGQSIEFDPGPSGPPTRSFTYTVSDGTERTATGEVTVTILKLDGENRVPRAVEDRITISKNGTAVVNVLANDQDEDGDGLSLVDATTDDGTLSTPQHRPDGIITVRAGLDLGPKTVNYKIVDDLGAEATGQLILTVEDKAVVVARDDVALGQADQQLTVRPLGNDLSPSGTLRVASVTAEGSNAGSLQVRDRSNEEVRFVAAQPGTYSVKYTAVDEDTGASGEGTIRLIVSAGEGRSPTAARDNAAVAVDVPVVIPVLSNDSDPDGDVLAVTGVDPGSREVLRAAGVEVEVLKRQYLRVTARRAIPRDEPLVFRYDVTDGTTAPVLGAVVVRGIDRAQDQPPIAADDELVIRPGRVAAVRVLDNDLDPEGGPLILAPPSADAAAGARSGISRAGPARVTRARRARPSSRATSSASSPRRRRSASTSATPRSTPAGTAAGPRSTSAWWRATTRHRCRRSLRCGRRWGGRSRCRSRWWGRIRTATWCRSSASPAPRSTGRSLRSTTGGSCSMRGVST